jgi:hypothetical protein
MPTTNFRIYSDVQGVVANGIATQQVPVIGETFGIMLEPRTSGGVALTAAQMIAEMPSIQVMLDGAELFNMQTRDVIALNDFYFAGRGGIGATPTAFTAGALYIPFDKPLYPNGAQQEAFAIGAADSRILQVNVTLGTPLTNLSRIGLGWAGNNIVAPTAQHLRVNNYRQTTASTGRFTIQNLPLEKNVGVLAFHAVVPVAAVIDQAVVYANGAEIIRINRNTNINYQKRNGRIPQLPETNATGFDLFTIDFNDSNDPSNFLRLQNVSELRVEFNFTGAAPGTFDFYREAVFGIPLIA